MNTLFKLKLTDALHPKCLLITLKGGDLQLDVTIGQVTVDATRTITDSGLRLNQSLTDFSSELSAGENQKCSMQWLIKLYQVQSAI